MASKSRGPATPAPSITSWSWGRCWPIRCATLRRDEAEAAIGGFVVLNDLSARDVQLDEMRSGFGPQKAKHFASAMSAEIVTSDEILPRQNALTGGVSINGRAVARCSTQNPRYTLAEAIAFASRDETLHPGELFGSGTLPGGSGMETGAWLQPGDRLTLTIDGVGGHQRDGRQKEDNVMIIDLTRPVAYNKNDPFFMRVKIKHKPHWIGALAGAVAGPAVPQYAEGLRGLGRRHHHPDGRARHHPHRRALALWPGLGRPDGRPRWTKSRWRSASAQA